jgi:hypothetical protein
MVIRPVRIANKKKDTEFKKDLGEALERGKKEGDYIKVNKIPSDEDIDFYFKMYLKKRELTDKEQWDTDEPMPFKEWKKKAKTPTEYKSIGDMTQISIGGWMFMVSQTSDGMLGIPPDQTYIRTVDYAKLVEEDEKC